MQITPKEKAESIYETWVYYWPDEGLKTKQILTHNVVAEIVRTLIEKGITNEELEYWHQVSIEIYNR